MTPKLNAIMSSTNLRTPNKQTQGIGLDPQNHKPKRKPHKPRASKLAQKNNNKNYRSSFLL